MVNLRAFENSSKFGYLFFIEYNGTKFESFDENSGKRSVKGDFIKTMNELGITWAKGVQQASRTDSEVSASENILYFSSNYRGDISKIVIEFNKLNRFLKIKKVEKTFPDLVIPDYVEAREYHYEIPEKYKISDMRLINERCSELSGTYDVSGFKDKKGLELKEHVREVNVTAEENRLVFKGNSFMPKQVRYMSGYILSGEKKLLAGKYLTLKKNIMKPEFSELIFKNSSDKVESVEKIEKAGDIYIFYVLKEKRGELIGKNGSNIKKLRKEYGKVVVKDFE